MLEDGSGCSVSSRSQSFGAKVAVLAPVGGAVVEPEPASSHVLRLEMYLMRHSEDFTSLFPAAS